MSCDVCEKCNPPKRKHQNTFRGASKRGDTHSESQATIALLGQPNSGKSTLFNGLTGSHQHIGNWPGKTVEQKRGDLIRGDKAIEVIDLPGAYGLGMGSPEEEVTQSYIASGEADAVVVFADASQLERSLYMLASYAGSSTPAMLVLNMMDVAQEQGKQIDVALMQQRLGIPVVPLVASDRKSYQGFYTALDRALENDRNDWEAPEGVDVSYSAAGGIATSVPASHDIRNAIEPAGGETSIQETTSARFAWISSLLDGAVTKPKAAKTLSKFDRLAIGSRWSKPFAILMILVGFLLAFVPALPIMGIGGLVSTLGIEVASALIAAGVPNVVGSLLSGVVFNALCFGIMMVGYVFGINLVFGIYEETGYMARISYVFDNTMSRFGLQGKSLMPFLMCLGCTMGGVSGSRVIDSWGQRMLTVAMSWAIPCGSTWGVVPVLAVAFFGLGAPLVIVAIFAVCLLLMWAVGKVFGPRFVEDGQRSGMVMELPPYHKPHMGNIVRNACLKSWQMFKRAIKVVAMFAFIIWALTYTSTGSVEGSLLYTIGTAIEPFTMVFGLNWELFTTWLSGMVLKESVLGVLSGLYVGTATPNAAIIGSVAGTVAVAGNIGEVMAASITAPQALAFIFAFTFNMPCAASVSATYGEIHSAKWVALIALFYIAASLLLGCAAFHIGSLLLA